MNYVRREHANHRTCCFVSVNPLTSPQAQRIMPLCASFSTFADLRPATSTLVPARPCALVVPVCVSGCSPLYRISVPFSSLPDEDCAVACPLGFGCQHWRVHGWSGHSSEDVYQPWLLQVRTLRSIERAIVLLCFHLHSPRN